MLTLLDRSGLFFQDLPRVHHRRQAGDHTEVVNEQTRGRRPNYYLQNFHFQTGGWMTEDSAKRYDLQVEVLFYGTANAIDAKSCLRFGRLSRDAISAGYGEDHLRKVLREYARYYNEVRYHALQRMRRCTAPFNGRA